MVQETEECLRNIAKNTTHGAVFIVPYKNNSGKYFWEN